MRIPGIERGRHGVSRADRSQDYGYKKRFYQDESVAGDYDRHRFGNEERRNRNARKWKRIESALAYVAGNRRVLDLPCGTGRFTAHLGRAGYDVVGSDISLAMMRIAVERLPPSARLHGFVRGDAERLPIRNGAVECVMSIRFLLHLDRASRITVIGEMARVSRRWLILDYRHKHSYRYLTMLVRRALGAPSAVRASQVSRREMEEELLAAGVRVARIFPVARFFSDKWIVLCEKSASA